MLAVPDIHIGGSYFTRVCLKRISSLFSPSGWERNCSLWGLVLRSHPQGSKSLCCGDKGTAQWIDSVPASWEFKPSGGPTGSGIGSIQIRKLFQEADDWKKKSSSFLAFTPGNVENNQKKKKNPTLIWSLFKMEGGVGGNQGSRSVTFRSNCASLTKLSTCMKKQKLNCWTMERKKLVPWALPWGRTQQGSGAFLWQK